MNTRMRPRSSTFLDESGAAGDSRSPLGRERVRALAVSAGFSDAGLVQLPHAAESRDAERFVAWVEAGHAGSMHYLTRTDDRGQLTRSRVAIPFGWAKSAIVCFANYQKAEPLSTAEAPQDAGWIARYAWSGTTDAQTGAQRPTDYHKVLLKRLRAMETQLRAEVGEFESRAYVDTGPVMERALATAAGLGWTGKNTCLIHPKLGSFGFVAVLLTSLEAGEPVSKSASQPVSESASQPVSESAREAARQCTMRTPQLVPDRCGTCRRCLDACPTGALIAPYQMDATKCISYLTIEHKGVIGEELMGSMGRQVFGCDICQDVCPWNRKAPVSGDAELATRSELVNPGLEWLAEMDEEAFARAFNGSPVRRAGWMGMRRNVAIAIGNQRVARLAPRLRQWATAADEGLRAAAQWALERIKL